MALQIPNLDDKKFEELAQEAVALIPRFSNEWTDHNVHDPGITFLELFAWLAEMQIYQLNRVTEKQVQKFLGMVGLAPLARQPAKVEIAFQLLPQAPGRFLASGTRVTTTSNEAAVFETEEDFFITQTKLVRVLTQIGAKSIDQTEANFKEGIQFFAFGEHAPREATLALGFDTPFSDAKEANIFFRLHEKDLPQFGSHSVEPARVFPSATLAWEYSANGEWLPLPLKRDSTFHLHYTGGILFEPPAAWTPEHEGLYWIKAQLRSGSYEIPPLLEGLFLNVISAAQTQTVLHEDLGEGLGTPDQRVRLARPPVLLQSSSHWRMRVGDIYDWFHFLHAWREAGVSSLPSPAKRFWSLLSAFWQQRIHQALLDEPLTDEEKFLLVTTLNEMTARRDLYEPDSFKGIELPEAYQRIFEESDCSSSGEDLVTLNRKLFEIAFAEHVARGAIVVQVQNAAYDWEEWQRVEDFERSAWEDRHYTLAPETGELTFGNGQNGRVPERMKKIRAKYYRTSLGAAGNLAAGLEWRVAHLEGAGLRGQNAQAASAGRDPEPVEDSKLRAQKEFNTRFRAITSEDFEQLALATPGLRVARARALPNFHPEFRCVQMPGNVTVVVVPRIRGEAVAPAPSTGFLQTVKQHLENHRLVTTTVHVLAPDYVAIAVSCKVFIKKKNDAGQVRQRVLQTLQNFLHPLKGGPDNNGWPFSRPVYASEIYQKIDQVEGVDHVVNVKLDAEALQQRGKKIITLPANALAYSGAHKIEVA